MKTLLTGKEWIPAATHGTSEAFAKRQKARMLEAQRRAKGINADASSSVRLLTPAKRVRAV